MSEARWAWVLTIGMLALVSCGDETEFYPEVGYYRDGEIAWVYGEKHSTLDACRDEAISLYNRYVAEGRAYSWACIEELNGTAMSKHR